MKVFYAIIGTAIAAIIPLTMLKIAIYFSDKNNKDGEQS